MTISKNFARVLLASSLAFTAHAFEQDGAPPAAPAGDAPAVARRRARARRERRQRVW